MRFLVKLDLPLAVLRIALIAALLPLAIGWRTPLFASWRTVALAVLLALPLMLLAIDIWTLRRARVACRAPDQRRLARACACCVRHHRDHRADVPLPALRRAGRRSGRARKARPAFPHRLSPPRRTAGAARSPRRRRRVHQRAERRGQVARGGPPQDRRMAGAAPRAEPSAAVGRDRSGRRAGVAGLAAADAPVFARRRRRVACRSGREARRAAPLRGASGPRARQPRRQPQFRAGGRPEPRHRQPRGSPLAHFIARDFDRPGGRRPKSRGFIARRCCRPACIAR